MVARRCGLAGFVVTLSLSGLSAGTAGADLVAVTTVFLAVTIGSTVTLEAAAVLFFLIDSTTSIMDIVPPAVGPDVLVVSTGMMDNDGARRVVGQLLPEAAAAAAADAAGFDEISTVVVELLELGFVDVKIVVDTGTEDTVMEEGAAADDAEDDAAASPLTTPELIGGVGGGVVDVLFDSLVLI